MNKLWAGITAGMLAGAAGATAKNAVSYLDQIVQDDAPPSSPAGATAATTASAAATVAAQTDIGGNRATALAGLSGLAVGVGVGAVAGAVRGENVTPNPVLAAVVTGLVAMGITDGAAAVNGAAKARSTTHLGRDLVAHLAYGGVTGWALHRLLDPSTPAVARFNPLR